MADSAEHERRLIAQCRHGDTESYGELVRLHQDRVFNIVLRLLGDYEDAQDAAQEVFVKAYNGLSRFRSDSRFSTWLYRIAVNTAYSAGRRRRAAPRVVPLSGTREAGTERSHASDDGDPVERAATAEEAEIIRQALGRLADTQRNILVLHELEGCSYAELAEILDCPRGTIKSKLHRARVALRGMVGHLMKSQTPGADSGGG